MPFESEKQRRFLWANKPEVARKFAEHAAEGKKIGGRRVTKGQKVGQSNIVPVLDELANFVPGIGDVKAFAEADTPLEYGLATLGLAPGVGDAAAGGIKTLLGATGMFGKSGRKSKKITDNPKTAEYLERLGLDPNDPKSIKIAEDMIADAWRVREGVPEIGVPSRNFPGVTKPTVRRDTGEIENPRDMLEFSLPDKAKWEELYGEVPYPSSNPNLLYAPSRSGEGENLTGVLSDKNFISQNLNPTTPHKNLKEMKEKFQAPLARPAALDNATEVTGDIAVAKKLFESGAPEEDILKHIGKNQLKKLKRGVL